MCSPRPCCNCHLYIGNRLKFFPWGKLWVQILCYNLDMYHHYDIYDRSKWDHRRDILWICLGHLDYHTWIRIQCFHNVDILLNPRMNLRNTNTACPGYNCQLCSNNILLQLRPLLEFDIHLAHWVKNHKRVELVPLQHSLKMTLDQNVIWIWSKYNLLASEKIHAL